MPPQFDLFHTPLDKGKLLIEAGAGTGKTFSLTGIVLRLLFENRIPLPQILIVTFTEAATAELRQRIRSLLIDLHDDLVGKATAADKLAAQFAGQLRTTGMAAEACRRLRSALADFDKIAVFTIHGFCARMLADNAFESLSPLEGGSLVPEEEIANEVAGDFWRKTFLAATDPAVLDLYRFANYDTPAKLADLLKQRPLPSSPETLRKPAPRVPDFSELTDLSHQLADIARADCESLHEIFSSSAINKSKYRDQRIHHILAFFKELPQSSHPLQCVIRFAKGPGGNNDGLEFISPSKIATACKKNQSVDSSHPAFQIAGKLNQLIESAKTNIPEAFRQWALPRMEEMKRSRNVMTFQDMLTRMHKAIAQPGLQTALRQRFQAALIDEFQDTDPLQLEIFTALFDDENHHLICVGDPKQSIYKFRGADLQCYLQARENHGFRLRSLRTNYRSEPEVVEAVNRLFSSSAESPFGAGIPFEPASLPEDKPLGHPPREPALLFRSFPDVPTEPEITDAVVKEIHHLLHRLQSSSYGSLAILVHTNSQAQSIVRRLQASAIPYLRSVDQNVFQTEAAILLRIAMQGLLNPGRPDVLKAALMSPLFGFKSTEIADLESNSQKLEEVIGSFDRLRSLWLEEGFMSAFQSILDRFQFRQRLLAIPGGGEMLSFYLQLAELVHRSEQQDHRSPQSIIQWLGDQIQGTKGSNSEEFRIRRPSDADAVIVSTIHASKGLQYDGVILPFLWKDPQSPDRDEEVRKLYVALTRARKAVVTFIPENKPKKDPRTALVPLLLGATGAASPAHAAKIVASQSEGFIGFSKGPAPAREFPPPVSVSNIEYTDPPPVPPPSSRLNSFSAMTRHMEPNPVIAEDPFAEKREDSEPESLLAKPVSGPRDPLPKGASIGTALHGILEQLDFTDPGDPTTIIRNVLRREGMDPSGVADTIANRIPQWLQTPLYPQNGFRLGEISGSHRLNELEFHFPVQSVSARQLADAIAGDEPVPGFANDLRNASPQTLAGFMTGFIDMVFHYKNKYYILDWKSNYLGPDPSCYTDDAVARSMREHLYPLQFLLYTVALDAWLTRRIPRYRYEDSFGGICYVYLRGFGGSPGKSVFRARPKSSTLHRLRSLLVP